MDLAGLAPGASLLTSEADLLSYSYDGALDRARPDAVLLARRAEEVHAAVEWCARRGVPFVARGAGTNLCGAAIASRGGVVIATVGMNRVLSIDAAAGTAVLEPGVVNLELQKQLDKVGRFYGPDPASYRVCTLGGNVAQNAGGPRCLKYGVTSDHILALEAVMPDGTVERFSTSEPGPDLVGLLVGAEGTLGVATRITVRTLPAPPCIVTLLAGFPTIEASIQCVSDIIAAGIVPRVLEAMDRMTVESIEAYCHAGYPKTEAVLLIELDGEPRQAEAEAARVEEIVRRLGAVELRRATAEAERERLWEGRRGAYAAVARIAPNVMVEDGVVPRGQLPEAVRRLRAMAEKAKITVPLLFHAGDGNLHPNMAYDERDAEQTRRVQSAGHEVLSICVELGGSISGEHGIGTNKRGAMAWLFTPETLALFRRVKDAFDPTGISNPDKKLPDKPQAAPVRGPRRELSAEARGVVEALREAARSGSPLALRGSKTKLDDGEARGGKDLSLAGLGRVLELDRANYSATVEAGMKLEDLRHALAAEGFHLPLGRGAGTLGGAIAAKSVEGLRYAVLGLRAALASGEVVELGGKVVKNVAGYDLIKVLLGSWGAYAAILEVTLRLAAKPPAWLETPETARRFVPGRWHRTLKHAFDPDNRLNPWIYSAGSPQV
ncbi:MAG: FAD-binding protein [Elusimicrobia bacterium]|nr:FAD-binding protein [Elusimicrobiota bacterium]